MKDNFNEMLDKTMQLIAIDSVQSSPCPASPFGEGVAKCLELVCETAKNFGMKVHNQEGYYCTCDIGEGETFGILGHIDVVPYDDDWTANPLGEIKDGVIYGRGILDDKGPMTCCLYAAARLLDEGYKPNCKIRFIFGGNEESGWKCIERYNEVDVMPEKGFSPDGDFPVINCEKGLVGYEIVLDTPPKMLSMNGGSRVNIVMAKCTCVMDCELTLKPEDKNVKVEVKDGKTYIAAYGKPAHASTPNEGDNALWKVLEYLSSALGGEYTLLKQRLCHTDGSGADVKLSDEKSGKLTFNVGVAQTGEDGKLKLLIDIRHPVTYTKEEILERLKKSLKTQDAKVRNFHDPLYIDKDNPLVQNLLSAYNEVTGENLSPITIGGGTYARALKCGVAFGPMFPNMESTIHQKDERVSIEDFRKMYDIYYHAIKKLLFT
ncbi:MAG: Sapep family Mn(2+)-dependent dipeptidase [Clostridia bacterium]|nr:Sapep family Mn(2+)-dependent dipeptidase [Clostridia bacterium]